MDSYSNDRYEALRQFAALANSNLTIDTPDQFNEFCQRIAAFTDRVSDYTADLSDIDKLAYLTEASKFIDAIEAKRMEAEARLNAQKHAPLPVAVQHFTSNTPSGITDEMIATIKGMPERFATTELFLETFARWENQKAEFLMLSDAGHLDSMDGDPRCDEVVALMPAMQRKLKQYDKDFAQAKANLTRRTAWDAVLLKRIFNLFQ